MGPSKVVCKRRAENEDMPLRQIFDDVWRTSFNAGQHLSFADLEAATYKRRRRAHPVLPTSSAKADATVSSSRYAQLEDSDFCREVADAGDNGSALIFATNAQLELLSSATQLYLIDWSFIPLLFHSFAKILLLLNFITMKWFSVGIKKLVVCTRQPWNRL